LFDELTARVREADGLVHVVFQGEIDVFSEQRFRELLADAIESARTGVRVDLTYITFFGCGGIECLEWARGAARDRGVGFEIRAVSRVVRRTLELIDMAHLVTATPAQPHPLAGRRHSFGPTTRR
jgi:anti-anti-sigma factor